VKRDKIDKIKTLKYRTMHLIFSTLLLL